MSRKIYHKYNHFLSFLTCSGKLKMSGNIFYHSLIEHLLSCQKIRVDSWPIYLCVLGDLCCSEAKVEVQPKSRSVGVPIHRDGQFSLSFPRNHLCPWATDRYGQTSEGVRAASKKNRIVIPTCRDSTTQN